MDILELLKTRLQPLYPQLAAGQSQFALPDTHGQSVAEQSQQGNGLSGLGSIIGRGLSRVASGGGDGDGPRVSEEVIAPDAQPYDVPPTSAVPLGGNRAPSESSAISLPTGGDNSTAVPLGGSRYEQFGRNASPPAVDGVGSGRQFSGADVPYDPVKYDTSAADTPQPPTATEVPALKRALTRREKIEADIDEITQKDYSNAVYRGPNGETSKKPKEGYVLEKAAGKNRDKSHNIIDVLKGIGLGALRGGATGGLGGMIGGAAAGGIGAGFDRNFDDKMLDTLKRESLQGELGAAQKAEIGEYKRQEAEAEARDAIDKPKREAAKATAEINEKRIKVAQEALKEALKLDYYDKKDPRQREIVKQSGIDPDQMPEFDNRGLVDRKLGDGTTIKIKGSDAWKEEQENARFDATKTHDVVKFNADNKLKVQQKNVENTMKFNDDVRTAMTNIAKANEQLISSAPEAQAHAQAMQNAAAAMSKAANDDDAEAFEAAQKLYDTANKGFSTAIGKAEGGKALAAELKKLKLTPPKMITYEEVKPTTLGGKKVSKSDLEDFARAKGWTPAQAQQYAANNGWEIQ